MRVSSPAAHQLQETSLLMHSFSFRCERGNFFGAQINLLALCISVTFPLGLAWGVGGTEMCGDVFHRQGMRARLVLKICLCFLLV